MTDETDLIDSSSRRILLLLAGSAILWLVVAGVLELVASIQLHSPAFLADCPISSVGRVAALAETAFIYGWLANAGLALALWILCRLGGEPLRAMNWAAFGTVFWNIGVLMALVGVAVGERTGFDFFELPRAVQPLLFFSYAAIAVPGVVALFGRRRETMYAAQWYAAAPLFLFPWIFSIVQLMLVWRPVHGVVQAVVGGWYVQAAWSLWIAPFGLAIAYYVIPKVTGRTVKSYEFALLGFWALIFLGAWTGGRNLIGSPVPAWIPAVGVVTTALIFVHYLIVLVNLREGLLAGGVAARFIAFGLVAYFISAVTDLLTSFHAVAVLTQFTHVEAAQRQLALYGSASMMLFGGLYYAVPRIAGGEWASAVLVKGHRALAFVGVALLVVGLAVAGLAQGHGLLDSKASFDAIGQAARPGLVAASVAQAVLLLGNILLLLNFACTACCCRRCRDGQRGLQRTAEASAS